MISISSDNQNIYTILESNELLFSDFDADQVIAFDKENDFYVVIYQGGKRDFVLFCAEKYLKEAYVLRSLIDKLEDMDDGMIPKHLIEKAVRITEEKLLSLNSPNLYFDAH